MDFSSYVMPELLILVPVLIILGRFLKESWLVYNETIPIILWGVSVTLCAIWVLGNNQPLLSAQGWFNFIFAAIVQGTLCAGTAVFGHQLFKQMFK